MKTLSAGILACWIGSANLSAQVFENKDVKISPLEEKTWVIETSDNTTMYLIEGSEKALLIDTGTKCDSLDRIVRHISSKPLYVVITHMHPDHAGNINYFDSICFHPADTVLYNRSYRGKVRFVRDGDVFDLGNKQIEVRHMPAHTPGSIVLIDRQTRSCYTGDAFGSGLVWLQLRPYASMQTYISSCKAMLNIMDSGIEKIYPGHYPYLKKPLYRDYLVKMTDLATSIENGTVKDPKPYSIKVSIGCDNPLVAWYENVGIVFDPEHIK